jgi:hypothetical protein
MTLRITQIKRNYVSLESTNYFVEGDDVNLAISHREANYSERKAQLRRELEKAAANTAKLKLNDKA